MKVTANVTRSGDWWAVEVPEIPGLFTQAKRLEQVAAVVTEAAATLGTEVDDVEVVPVLDEADRKLVADVLMHREVLRKAEAEAAAANRKAAARLRAEGLPVRDVAALMGISPQRVSALR